MEPMEPVSTADVARLVELVAAARDAALAAARRTTQGGRAIDEHQVLCERLAYAATEVAAAEALLDHVRELEAAGRRAPQLVAIAGAFAAEVAARVREQLELDQGELGLDPAVLERFSSAEARALVRAARNESRVRAIGREAIATGGTCQDWIDDDVVRLARETARRFARTEVAPHAERIHRNDELVPESIIRAMAELGYFGMSVPETYGGGGMGNLAMVVTTEELSAVSLAAAGSLITRPEILTKALLAGGTEAQKRRWLPPIAAGEIMVAIAVTEPDVGSDVASLTCRAEPAQSGGRAGYRLSGSKAWCTFAGRADVLALLARTEPDPKLGARGLSLFIVEKDRFTGHAFEMRQADGGLMTGKADPTPGYRGMHSFTLQLDGYFVPAENLIGEEAGKGKGFYLQMAGFAAGRLQTGARATGLAQAALEASAAYAAERRQFGRPIGEFQLTQYKLGQMATQVAAARQLTYAAARAMDRDEGAALRAAMAKLFASDVAVRVTQEGQLLHGGWGYAEEFPISRYVADALVLPIFEGVKPILELKVIARALLAER